MEAWGLEQSKEALQSLTETAELVGRWFLSSGVGDILPVPQYDQFAFMDQPLATADGIDALREAWFAFGRETSQWHMVDALDELSQLDASNMSAFPNFERPAASVDRVERRRRDI